MASGGVKEVREKKQAGRSRYGIQELKGWEGHAEWVILRPLSYPYSTLNQGPFLGKWDYASGGLREFLYDKCVFIGQQRLEC